MHTVLLLTEKPGEWAPWCVALFPLALAVAAGWIWDRAGGPAWGWASAAVLLLLALADGGLLAALPRWGVSFGPVQPPFLALVLVRWSISAIAAAAAIQVPAAAWIVQAVLQILVLALMAYGTLLEPFRLKVGSVEVTIPRGPNPGPDPGPASGSGLRIVQLSDLHVERLTRRERSLPGLVKELAPDLIVLTGDFLSTTYNDDPRAVADLQVLLAQLEAPLGLYAVWGTREVDLPSVLRPALEQVGVVVLEDEAREVVGDGCHLWLMGLTCSRDLAADGDRLRTLLARAPAGTPSLLLYHLPDLMPQAAALGIDLYLAGHTHGGQWRLPGFGALLTSSRYGKRYEAGHYHQGRTHLYVSRGLGLEGFGTPRARFFCPPEVVIVSLLGCGQD